MKITDPNVIKNGEKDLIEAVKDDLDLDAVKEILKKRMTGANLLSKGGELVVYNNEIAFRLDFDIQLSGSLMFDRQGNYITGPDEATDAGEIDEASNAEETYDADEEIDDADEEIDTAETIDVEAADLETEDPISEELDFDDIDITETLEEVAPQTISSDPEDTEMDAEDDILGEELNIDLPDYDLNDNLDDLDEKISNSEDILDNETEIDDLEELTDTQELDLADETDDLIDDDLIDDDLIDDDLVDDDLVDDDLVDDDINDILTESRDFWEQKKDS